MSVTKTKMDVVYLKTKVEDAKKKYIKQHALDTAAYVKAKTQYDKDMAKYYSDLMTKFTAAVKAGRIEVYSEYSHSISFRVKNGSNLSTVSGIPARPSKDNIKDPGTLNTKPFDAKLAILEGCSETFISISVEDQDWMQVLL